MRIGIINPIKYLKYSTELFLCYSTLLHNPTYLEFTTKFENLVILDYSPNLPRQVNLVAFRENLRRVKLEYVILPSSDYSADKTIELSREFLRKVKIKSPVGVLQGFDLDSLRKCYKFMGSHCAIIALPSPLETIARREEIVRDLGIKEKILWLEVYTNPYEEVPPSSTWGICTSFPVRVAQVNKRLSEFKERPRTPVVLDFFNNNLVEELIKENIREYIEVVEHEKGQVT